MTQLYSEPNRKRNGILSYFFGAAIVALLFLAIPFTQFLSESPQAPLEIAQLDLALPPPPPPPEMQEPPQEEEIEELEIEEEIPDLTLEQLEMSLQTGLGGSLDGDFALPSVKIASHEIDDIDFEIYDLSDIDENPVPIIRFPPKIPAAVRRISATASIVFIVNQEGKVEDVKVESASNRLFAKAAVIAVTQWKFQPGKKDGKAVKVRMRQPFKK